jgi:hypothetical protein
VLFCVLFVCKCVLPPGDNPSAVNKYINICTNDTSSDKNGNKVSVSMKGGKFLGYLVRIICFTNAPPYGGELTVMQPKEGCNCTANYHTLKADSHIACRAHAAPMPFPCHAMR